MWLVVGLGNPGPRYARTRHNFGWMAVEALARSQGLVFRETPEGRALAAEWPEKAVLLLPLTYMNLSGEAVASALRRWPVPRERVLVVYDDLDLPLGRLKLAPRGGSGGHRGMASVLASLGTEEIPRLRMGIGRPARGIPVPDYVLSEFAPEEWPLAERILTLAGEAVRTVLEEGLARAMTLYNRRDLLQNVKGEVKDGR